ncbi:hypothetical protein PLESTB_001043900 [Pleodorina starrii]|uniref:Protein kinase domain-containing protein n=1 Tax=Pleodorina starrii TaxID=330485 RepID=A0A9W6BP72_9CHLO|nr:hypothetical protein PLESTB_001043900 [Pleodorina starrii]
MDAEKRYALKIERRRDVRSVKQEFKVLKKIQERAPSLVCTVHACGTFEDRFFMIMELLGNNVAEARKAAGGRFDLATVRRLATSMLGGLEEVHAAGFVHRDVKPANFAVGPAFADPLTGMWKVIDFGLARRYLDDAGEVLPERTDTSFRGSTTYASVHAHAEQDLGRRDDLWSWLYCTIELLEGTLPWRTDLNKDPDSRDGVLRMKQACIADPSRYLRSGGGGPGGPGGGGPHHPLLQPLLLGPVQQLSNYIASLGFADAPDYGLMYACLAQLPDDVGGLMPGLGPGSLAAAAGMAPGMWGLGGPEAQYSQQHQQAAAAAAAAAQMMYHQQYYGHHHHPHHQHQQQHHAQLPPGMAPGGGYWPARGGWGDPSMYAHQQQQQQLQQQQHPQAQPHQHHQQQQQQQLQQQQHQRYVPGGPPPPPDPGRSSPPPPLDNPASPPAEFRASGGGAGGPEPPPLPPPVAAAAGPQGTTAAAAAAAPRLADVPSEVAEGLLAEALAERAGPDQSREAAQVAEVHEYVELVKQGHVSDEAHDVAGRLMGLEPVEALATISYVLDALAAHAAPATANTAAVALSALGAYARDAAKRAMTKYCRALAAQHQPQLLAPQQQPQQQPQVQQQQQQQQHQQQQRGPGRGGGPGS